VPEDGGHRRDQENSVLHEITDPGANELHELAAVMAAATDAGDRVTAVDILRVVERAAGVDLSGPDEALMVLARRFASAHRALLRCAEAGCHDGWRAPTGALAS
jgi:hypothetical protein